MDPEILADYPYRETRPDTRCHWWSHPAAVVQYIPVSGVERYDCACGRFRWFSDAPLKVRVGRVTKVRV